MLDVLEVAAEPTRKRLIQLLGSGERTVTELAGHFPVSRSAISQHLLLLIEAGLLDARKVGRQRYYSLNRAGIARLKKEIESSWNTELDLLAAEASQLAAGGQPTASPMAHPGEQPCASREPSSSLSTRTPPSPWSPTPNACAADKLWPAA